MLKYEFFTCSRLHRSDENVTFQHFHAEIVNSKYMKFSKNNKFQHVIKTQQNIHKIIRSVYCKGASAPRNGGNIFKSKL